MSPHSKETTPTSRNASSSSGAGGLATVSTQSAVNYIAGFASDVVLSYNGNVEHVSNTNAVGAPTRVITLASTSSAGAAALGAASALAAVSVLAAGAAVPLLLPTLTLAHQAMVVAHLSGSALTDTLAAVNDHAVYYLNARSGAPILISRSAAEAQHLAAIAHSIAAATRKPVLHFFDGSISNRTSSLELLSSDAIANIVYGPGRIADTVSCYNAGSILPPSSGLQQFFDHASKFLSGATVYKHFEYSGSPTAELVFVSLGETSVTLEQLVSNPTVGDVGHINVRVLRPWQPADFLAALPKAAKRVIVVDEAARAIPRGRGPLYLDVVASLYTLATRPRVLSVSFNTAMQTLQWHLAVSLLEHVRATSFIDTHFDLAAVKPVENTLVKLAPAIAEWVVWSTDKSPLSELVPEALDTSHHTHFHSASTFDASSDGKRDVVRTHAGVFKTNLRVLSDYQSVNANLVVVLHASLVEQYSANLINQLQPHGTLLINTNWAAEAVESKLPADLKRAIARKSVKVLLVNTAQFGSEDVLVKSGLKTVILLAYLLVHAKLAAPEAAIASLIQAPSNSAHHGVLRLCLDGAKEVTVSEAWAVAEEAADRYDKAPRPVDLSAAGRATLPSDYEASDINSKKNFSSTNWHTVAKQLLFPEAYSTRWSTRPDAEKIYTVKVSEMRRLTPLTYDRNVFHLEMDISGTGMTYKVGDALGVYGHNDPAAVDAFLKWYGVDPNTLLTYNRRSRITHDPSSSSSQYGQTHTLRHLFTQVLDIFGRPSKQFYEFLASLALDASEKDRLDQIIGPDGKEEFKRRVDETMTYEDLLREFRSARPTLEHLLDMVPPIKPRHYSIASAMSMHPDSVHLLVVTHDWVTPSGRRRIGQCTRYLELLQVGDVMTVCTKPSVMTLPEDDSLPVVMAGLGTGMAPFRAFIEERAFRKSQGKKVGPMALYFGSRHRSQEYLYGEDLEAYQAEGLLSYLGLAFSRDTDQKVYIQHKMQEHSRILKELIVDQGGSFYLCGPTWPAGDVQDAISDSLRNHAGMSKTEALETIRNLKEHERYVLEVY